MGSANRRCWLMPTRLAAALILTTAIIGHDDVNAADESTCRGQEQSACLTSGDGGPYEEMHCTGGENCYTCNWDPGAVCEKWDDTAQDYSDDVSKGV